MKTYLKQATPEEREDLAVKVESSVGYLYLIGGGHRKAGTDLCKALVAAEPKLTLHELRPDIWDADPLSRKAQSRNRSTDPEPSPGRTGRQPPDASKLMSAAVVQPALARKSP